MPELPEKVYVYWVKIKNEEYLSVEETAQACGVNGVKRLVGEYALERKMIVALRVKEEIEIDAA